jgi:NADP-dependent 3-hydroxy acid dehydrogenase YdfG
VKDVVGKVAFITGGASGIGLAMARSFSAAGMKVAIADIEQAALEVVHAEFSATNAEVITLNVDVTDRAAMEGAARDTEAAFGNVHVVCNNAGVVLGGPIHEMSYEDWDWVLGVNVNGVINGVRTFVDRLIAHGEGGHFVNTASIAGLMGLPGASVYNASKFAVVGLSEAMRLDLEPCGIGVSVLCPGYVHTGIFAAERNRPERLRADADEKPRTRAEDTAQERDESFDELSAAIIDPAVVGEMVLAGIQNDDFYIFTHPQTKQRTDARADQMTAAYARWSAYRNDRGI